MQISRNVKTQNHLLKLELTGLNSEFAELKTVLQLQTETLNKVLIVIR